MLASVNEKREIFGAKNVSTSDNEPRHHLSKRIHPYIKPYLRGVALFPLVVIGSWLISIFVYGITKVVSPFLLIPVVQIATVGILAWNRRWALLLGYVSVYVVNLILTVVVISMFEAFSPGTLGMFLPSIFLGLSLLGAQGWLLIIIFSLL